MSPLMACTPLGRQVSRHTARSVLVRSMGLPSQWEASARRNSSGSVVRCSRRRSASSSPRAARAAASSDTTIWARLSVGMALSLLPPAASPRRSCVRADTARRQRPRRTLALARPRWISVPECPPVRPPTVTVSTAPGKGSRFTGRMHSVRLPPAQLTVNTPSSSESRLMRVLPRRGDTSRAAAPSMPTSSSTVRTTSRRGWGMSWASSRARAMATAMPSSPPRVVPRAVTKSPSTSRSSPSRSRSLGQPGSFSHTMSRWPWRITGSAPS